MSTVRCSCAMEIPRINEFKALRTGSNGYPSCASVSKHSVRKLQLSQHRLEARLLAQGVHERVDLEVLQVGIAKPQGRLEPFERLRLITPLSIDRGVLVRRGVTLCGL